MLVNLLCCGRVDERNDPRTQHATIHKRNLIMPQGLTLLGAKLSIVICFLYGKRLLLLIHERNDL